MPSVIAVLDSSICPDLLPPAKSCRCTSTRVPLPLDPVLAEGFQPRKGFPVFGTTRCFIAGDDVINMTHRKALYIHTSAVGIFEPLYSVWSEHQIKIEGSVLQLHEIFSPDDFSRLFIRKSKTDILEGVHKSPAVFRIFYT